VTGDSHTEQHPTTFLPSRGWYCSLQAPAMGPRQQHNVGLRVVGLSLAFVAFTTSLAVWRPTCAPLSDAGEKPISRNAAARGLPLGALLVPLTSAGQTTLQTQCLDYRGAYEQIYRPQNLSACQAPASVGHVQCWPLLAKDVNCESLFTEYIYVLQHHQPLFPPPKQMLAEYKDMYLLKGLAHFKEFYFEQSSHAPDAKVPVWTESMLNPLVELARSRKQMGSYPRAIFSIYEALDCHPIGGLSGAVFGTDVPWAEAILFAFGKKK